MSTMSCWGVRRNDGEDEVWRYNQHAGTFSHIDGHRIMTVEEFEEYCVSCGAKGPVDALLAEDENWIGGFDDLYPPRPTGYEKRMLPAMGKSHISIRL